MNQIEHNIIELNLKMESDSQLLDFMERKMDYIIPLISMMRLDIMYKENKRKFLMSQDMKDQVEAMTIAVNVLASRSKSVRPPALEDMASTILPAEEHDIDKLPHEV
jgi:hypothetical protein